MTYKADKAGVVGAAGFAGIELVRLLLDHPQFDLEVVTSDALANVPVSEAYPAFEDACDLSFSTHDEARSVLNECDVVFLAVPHTAAMGMAPELVSHGVTVIDLSADFRLKDPSTYEAWYKTPHTAPDLLQEAAFGLPEITGNELARAAARHAAGPAVLVGCAGCYPTALAAAPAIRAGLVDPNGVVVVDAISGVTGAGKKATERTHFCFANENLEAYGVATHRHTPEIEQILGLQGRLVFTPHLAPLNRGLLSTVNLPLAPGADVPSTSGLVELYRGFYANSPLVSVLPEGRLPKTASVAGTNRAHVGLAVHETARMIIAVGAIDNIGKGAAGQAVQCANIVFGLTQTMGLDSVSVPV